jgi:hypothetical protein
MWVLDKFPLLEMEQKSTTQVAKVLKLDSVKAVFAVSCVFDLAYLASGLIHSF